MRGRELADSRQSFFMPSSSWRLMKRETRGSAHPPPPLPTSPAESPKKRRSGGRGEIRWDADPGRRDRLLPSHHPGLRFWSPRWGSQVEAAASCRCTSRRVAETWVVGISAQFESFGPSPERSRHRNAHTRQPAWRVNSGKCRRQQSGWTQVSRCCSPPPW